MRRLRCWMSTVGRSMARGGRIIRGTCRGSWCRGCTDIGAGKRRGGIFTSSISHTLLSRVCSTVSQLFLARGHFTQPLHSLCILFCALLPLTALCPSRRFLQLYLPFPSRPVPVHLPSQLHNIRPPNRPPPSPLTSILSLISQNANHTPTTSWRLPPRHPSRVFHMSTARRTTSPRAPPP